MFAIFFAIMSPANAGISTADLPPPPAPSITSSSHEHTFQNRPSHCELTAWVEQGRCVSNVVVDYPETCRGCDLDFTVTTDSAHFDTSNDHYTRMRPY